MHPWFKKYLAVFGSLVAVILFVAAVTKINLKEQATPPGNNGQLLFNNNGVVDAEDPIVSQATASNLNAQVVGNIASGGADSGNPVKTGCVFNTTQPTVTTGQRVDCQASSRGEIFVAPGVSGFSIANTGFNVNNFPTGFNVNNTPAVTQSGGPWTMNVTQWASAALGAMANYGTSPGAVLVPGVNAFITNTPAVTISGTPTVTANAGTGTFNIQANASVNLAQIAGSSTVADPCQVNAKTYDSQSITANTQIITGTAAKKIYFCSFSIVVGAATSVAIVEGTGTTCATGTAKFPGLSGGTTAATGWNFAANGGLTQGNGQAAFAAEGTNADNVCVLVSAANQTNLGYSYVVQ